MKSPLVRSIMAVFVALFVCFVVIVLFQFPAGVLHPDRGVDWSDPEQVNDHIRNAPTSAMLCVLAGYVVGPFLGGWVAARLAGRTPLLHAGIVAAFFFLASVSNLRQYEHPIWFAVANLTLFVPAVYLAAVLARPRAARPETEPAAQA